MRKAMGLLLVPLCAVVVLSLLTAPQSRIQHQDSSAFKVALQQAVDRLEGGGKLLLAGTATPAAAIVPVVTYDGGYTCETYDVGRMTCDPAAGCLEHTADPQGHTCSNEMYTCQVATCDTYDPMMETCDPNNAACAVPHTSESAPFNHTCDGHTCDGAFTCDFTVDPRAMTCDAADVDCQAATFNVDQLTCNWMREECRENNPGHCTGEMYNTCDPSVPTCEAACATIDPNDPNCGTPVNRTTWGDVKAKYHDQ
jgi:hypothetical protein